MLKSMKLLKTTPWRSIWLCRNLSGSIMKNFVSTITFFKTYIHVLGVKDCKVNEIGVKVSLEPCGFPIQSPPPSDGGGRGWGWTV